MHLECDWKNPAIFTVGTYNKCLNPESLNAMWKWSLNWSEVTKDIVIGTCPMTPDDLIRIQKEARVTALLSLQHDDCLTYWGIDYFQMQKKAAQIGLTLARLQIRDFDIADMRRRLPSAISSLAVLQASGHRTYVHCTAGLGRSPLVVLSYLILVDDYDPEEAISMILASRTDAVPAWEAYHGCRYDLVESFRKKIERRAYELYEQGTNDSLQADWQQAEREVLQNVLTGSNSD
ncbi:MAG TPA: dual specificity protein phosphatase family protein [Gammaproteobacteria bacterium]|nr:dual specificity protein phosphatase family protein [Gammaproteobacteria bacterium]